uniref:Uncharacterized protein n=1 Tax=Escherichia coli TaxID=562 RepID=A0A7U1E255_ECOLX|nr:hypothetical protein [Escherichia coli]
MVFIVKYYLFVMINTLQIKTDVFNKLKYTNLSFYFSWQLKSNSTVLFIHFDICVKSLMYNNYNVQYQSTDKVQVALLTTRCR